MKTKVAFFDIDGTIFRSSLLIELINELIEKNIFPKLAEEEIKIKRAAWLNQTGRYEDYLNKVVEMHLKYIKGCREEDIMKVVEDIIYFKKDRIYKFTRDLIKKLKKEGYFLVAISGSPAYLVKQFVDYMGFDLSFGQILEVKNGIFTGEIVNKNFLDKESIIRDFEKREGIELNLDIAIAVGDTENDIKMLQMVGNPIAFNPTRSLAELAKQKGWRIVVERKDAIYEIKDSELLPYEGMGEKKL